MKTFSKAMYIALFAVAAMPAMASETTKLPAQPIVAEAPKVITPAAPVVAPTTGTVEVLPQGELNKVDGKIEEKKELIKGELKQDMPAPSGSTSGTH